MVKNRQKINLLIKKNLVDFLKEKGVKGVNSEVIETLNKYYLKDLDVLTELIKQEMLIQGKKTLDKNVLERVFDKKINFRG